MTKNLLLLSVCLLPLLINPTITLNFDEVYLWPKLWWIYGVVLPSAAGVFWTYRRQVDGKALVFFGVFIGWLTLAALLTDPSKSLLGSSLRADGILMHGVYVLVALAVFAWLRAEPLDASRRLEQAFSWLTVPLSLLVLLQHFGLLGVFGSGAISGVAPTVAGGTLGNRGYMGGLLALLLPFAAMWFIRRPVVWRGLALFLLAAAIAATLARGAWVAALLGYLIWTLGTGNWRTWRVHLPLVLGIMLPFVPLTQGQPTKALNLDNSGRGVLWQSAIFGIRERPLFGWGADGVIRAMHARPASMVLQELGWAPGTYSKSEVSPSRTEYSALLTKPDGKRVLVGTSIDKVHNEYLDYAVSYGIPAALLFAALLALGIWRSYRVAPAYAGALVAYAVYLLTWPEVIRFAPLAWAVLGGALAVGAGRRSRRTTSDPPPSPPTGAL